ncbi:hypothetical protein NBRC13296_12090 [Paenibacillus chitinolyticus]|uniref:hypothetical protein n=1 Tax=Paenibacillus chitinolyticus TaxID=79263 RepID=UPI003555DCDC
MKKFKSVILSLTLAFSLTTVTSTVSAASVADWSFSSWSTGSKGVHTIYSSTFEKPATADDSITISGWQDTGNYNSVNLEYSIVDSGWFANTYGTTQSVSSNYPKSGNWFSKVFSNIPTGKKLVVKIYSPNSHTNPVSGAGNAYD